MFISQPATFVPRELEHIQFLSSSSISSFFFSNQQARRIRILLNANFGVALGEIKAGLIPIANAPSV